MDTIDAIPAGAKYQIWSLMSTSEDQYVSIPSQRDSESVYDVKATGTAATDASTSIQVTFHRLNSVDPEFHLSFNDHYIYGTTTGIVAKQRNNRTPYPTAFAEIYMKSPNKGLYALRTVLDGITLFLSSDGNGNMKLITCEKFPPPDENRFIDPALLFRLVEPKIEAEIQVI